MNYLLKSIFVALAMSAAGVAFSESPASGQEVFAQQCRTCHGGTRVADSPIGPRLTGIMGTKAGTRPYGIHSRALAESGVVWDRASLRRFLADPWGAVPGTLMPVRVQDPDDLESLLDYLETLQ